MSKDAIEVARLAVLEIAEADSVGDFLQLDVVEGFEIYRFASTHPGYVDWRWSCSISPDATTINEIWLEPGPDSLIAKPWLPWSERIQPGDLTPGDVVPTSNDDERLRPGYTEISETELTEPLSPSYWEIGLGRERALSETGLADAVYRWREGEHGPRTQFARYADLPCSSCGWLLTIGGRLGQAFGVCANPISPSDGRVVTMDHGCGAHSESVVETGILPVTEIVIDEFGYEEIDRTELPEAVLETETEAITDSEVDAVADAVTDLEVEPETAELSEPQESELDD